MSLSSFMTKDVITLDIDDNLSKAKQVFDQHNIHHILIKNGKELSGIITDRDLYKHLSPNIGTKKETPKDIDIVTFLDYNVVETRNQDLLDQFWTFSLEKEGIDAYIVKSYPSDHVQYQNYLRLRQIWADRYAQDRNQQSKGFIKIIFSKQ